MALFIGESTCFPIEHHLHTFLGSWGEPKACQRCSMKRAGTSQKTVSTPGLCHTPTVATGTPSRSFSLLVLRTSAVE